MKGGLKEGGEGRKGGRQEKGRYIICILVEEREGGRE